MMHYVKDSRFKDQIKLTLKFSTNANESCRNIDKKGFFDGSDELLPRTQ